MLKQVISLQNIGRFKRCGAPKGGEFGKVTLMYAENGRGKTTFAAVLRSLATGEFSHIAERSTLGASNQPEAELRIGSSNHRLSSGAWTATAPQIEIFDSRFVTDNVYNGETVDLSNRRNLAGVILGAAGVALADDISRLDGEIRAQNREIDKAKLAVAGIVPKGMTLETFIALADEPDLDKKIVAKADELQAANSLQAITSTPDLSALSLPTLPAEFPAILGKTVADITEDAEKRLRAHLEKHKMGETGEAWVAEGVGYIAEGDCPMCGQDISGNKLIEAFKGYFGEAYAALGRDVEAVSTAMERGLGNGAVTTLSRVAERNEVNGAFWQPFVSEAPPKIDIDADVGVAITAMHVEASALLKAKRASIASTIRTDASLATAHSNFQAAVAKIEAYNDHVVRFNGKIAAKKAATAASNAATISQDLERLKATKARHLAANAPLCGAYIKALGDKKALETQKETAKDALDKHSASVMKQYENDINDLLDRFNAGFRIGKVEHNYLGGVAGSSFHIVINGTPVALGDGKVSGKPSFRSTLSSGDKSTLALAFFLAKLTADPAKASKIVLFDDPFNSQDRFRRNTTKELIRKVAQECAQVLVLSHDPHFLKLVGDAVPAADIRTLQFSRLGIDGTVIETWDMDQETRETYFVEHVAVTDYVNGTSKLSKIDVARKMRPLLEAYCRYRFPNRFLDSQWLGDMIGIIRAAGTSDPMCAIVQELSDINDYSKRYHHDTNANADKEPISDAELQGFLKRTLRIVGGY